MGSKQNRQRAVELQEARDRIADLEAWLDEALCKTTDLEARLAEAEAVVEKLQKTADGVPVYPGQALYESGYGEEIRQVNSVDVRTFPDCALIEDCYSTREAAEAARNKENQK